MLLSFFTGCAFLIYEILWVRMLAVLIGNTTSALAMVVAIYMAGFGFGSLLFGRIADHASHLVRLWRYVLSGIAGGSLVTFIFLQTDTLHVLGPLLAVPGDHFSLLTVLPSFCMFLTTFCMGGVLPILSRIYIKDTAFIGRGVGILYGTNTLGSIIGALVTGYLLIQCCGQTFTYAVAFILIAGSGSITFGLPSLRNTGHAGPFVKNEKPFPLPSSRRALLLVLSCTTGFCGLALEILWMRVLRTYVANATYSTTNILVTFLFGLVIGSLLFARYVHKKNLFWIFGLGQILLAGYILISLFFINRLPFVLFSIRQLLLVPVLRIVLPGIVLAGLLVLVPTLIMGMTFPLLCRLYTRTAMDIGKGVGKIYFMNTTGSVAGSLAAAFLIIPLIGLSRGLALIAIITIINVMLLIPLWRKIPHFKQWMMIHSIALLVLCILVIINMHQRMILPPSLVRSSSHIERILYYRETIDGTIIVSENVRTGIKACYINNNAVCGTTYDALKVVKMLGHIPSFYPGVHQNALVIGFGTGITTASLAQHEYSLIDCVEICPQVADASRHFAEYNDNVLTKSTVKLIPGDGRIYIMITPNTYDVISCDPTHPTLGCNSLYTVQYFLYCKQHIPCNGVVCQYLPLHKLSLEEFKISLRTFTHVFPYVTVWLGHAHAVMVGTTFKQQLRFDDIFNTLQKIDDPILDDPYDMVTSLILDEQAIDAFVSDGPLNTDDHPYLEFFTFSSISRDNWDRNLYEMLKYRIDPQQVIGGIPDQERLQQYLAAQRYFLSALIFKNRGEIKQMLQALQTAHTINPQSSEIRFFLRHEQARLKSDI